MGRYYPTVLFGKRYHWSDWSAGTELDACIPGVLPVRQAVMGVSAQCLRCGQPVPRSQDSMLQRLMKGAV